MSEIDLTGWSPAPHVETPFPAQVRVERVDVYPPLLENEYRPVLDSKKNYIMQALVIVYDDA